MTQVLLPRKLGLMNRVKAIFRPSGDHVSASPFGVSLRFCLPSAFMTWMPCLLLKANRFPVRRPDRAAVEAPLAAHVPKTGPVDAHEETTESGRGRPRREVRSVGCPDDARSRLTALARRAIRFVGVHMEFFGRGRGERGAHEGDPGVDPRGRPAGPRGKPGAGLRPCSALENDKDRDADERCRSREQPRRPGAAGAGALPRLLDQRLDQGLELLAVDGIAGARRARRGSDGHGCTSDTIAIVLLAPC